MADPCSRDDDDDHHHHDDVYDDGYDGGDDVDDGDNDDDADDAVTNSPGRHDSWRLGGPEEGGALPPRPRPPLFSARPAPGRGPAGSWPRWRRPVRGVLNGRVWHGVRAELCEGRTV